jgi:hypothetical protein
MRAVMLCFVALTLASAPSPSPSIDAQIKGNPEIGTKVPEKVLRSKLEYARKTYEEYVKSQEFRSAETPYQWSCRWLDAQRQLSDSKKEQKAAVDAHLRRMEELRQTMDQLYREKLVGIEQVYATAFYVAEAEGWVAQSKD